MMFQEKDKYDIYDFLIIIKKLRSENGCPWDKEQTHESIKMNLLEEAYEVIEAIELNDRELLCEELGDLLLQIVFHAQMEDEKGSFKFDDVADGICKKMIYRHPHVFGNLRVENSEEVLENWEKLKSKSKGETTVADGMERVPKILPALIRGQKIGKKAANAGLDFEKTEDVIESVKKELSELEIAISNKNDKEIEEEFGDVLFSCCNLGRFLKKDSEKVLTSAINKFIMRFRAVEKISLSKGISLDTLSAFELDSLWEQVKHAK